MDVVDLRECTTQFNDGRTCEWMGGWLGGLAGGSWKLRCLEVGWDGTRLDGVR